MNRTTISSLERQARALGATGVRVLVDGHTLVDVGDTSGPVRVHSVRKSLISALDTGATVFRTMPKGGRIALTAPVSAFQP